MKVGVPRESADGERRVALVPDVVKRLQTKGVEVVVEAGAGEPAHHVRHHRDAALPGRALLRHSDGHGRGNLSHQECRPHCGATHRRIGNGLRESAVSACAVTQTGVCALVRE